ncbi:MAG: tRNA (adenosine(37)-N6)-threonylcarbamoyltransferase complex dimerization subunit type 1 TsaB [candidate division Zixibacteria bacterium]|nr:tRNA (adenosine(37)-N6)-threonylcarbamoyltransferase complex dimerization subunit type 1 TsaB [candidate division Zixibacteria bacterium]
MNVFVIDTSTETGTVGISSSDDIVADIHFEIKKGSTSSVHSHIEIAFEKADLLVSQLDLIGVVIGPGSFTGLRVALAAAKGLAHPYKIPIVGIDTMTALASVIHEQGIITTIIDARRSQFYRGIFKRDSDGLHRISGPEAVDADIIFNDVPQNSILTGPGTNKIKPEFVTEYRIPTKDLFYPSTRELCKLTAKLFREGHILDLENSTPLYIRKPDAKPELRQN